MQVGVRRRKERSTLGGPGQFEGSDSFDFLFGYLAFGSEKL